MGTVDKDRPWQCELSGRTGRGGGRIGLGGGIRPRQGSKVIFVGLDGRRAGFVGIAAMALSSVSVIANFLRLRTVRLHWPRGAVTKTYACAFCATEPIVPRTFARNEQ